MLYKFEKNCKITKKKMAKNCVVCGEKSLTCAKYSNNKNVVVCSVKCQQQLDKYGCLVKSQKKIGDKIKDSEEIAQEVEEKVKRFMRPIWREYANSMEKIVYSYFQLVNDENKKQLADQILDVENYAVCDLVQRWKEDSQKKLSMATLTLKYHVLLFIQVQEMIINVFEDRNLTWQQEEGGRKEFNQHLRQISADFFRTIQSEARDENYNFSTEKFVSVIQQNFYHTPLLEHTRFIFRRFDSNVSLMAVSSNHKTIENVRIEKTAIENDLSWFSDLLSEALVKSWKHRTPESLNRNYYDLLERAPILCQ